MEYGNKIALQYVCNSLTIPYLISRGYGIKFLGDTYVISRSPGVERMDSVWDCLTVYPGDYSRSTGVDVLLIGIFQGFFPVVFQWFLVLGTMCFVFIGLYIRRIPRELCFRGI